MAEAKGSELARAYIKLIPSTDGLKSQIVNIFGETGKSSGNTFRKLFGAVIGVKAVKKGVNTLKNIGNAALQGMASTARLSLQMVAEVSKQAIQNYADYEQLVGGVDTLFQESSDVVQTYAANAYKTAGLSANAYMETVTGFSASLIKSLDGDTVAAAKSADTAITDMADNANKMGTDMELIQNAYQGFAKQNYTMLDNLKLGYGGTKTEMERLLADATALSGVEYDISSFADITEAIHVVQTEMGITGTTALEASSTISGSVASMKAAWTNFTVGLADENADLDLLMNNLIDSVMTVGENIIPKIQTLLPNLTLGIITLVNSLIVELPGILETVGPVLASGAADLVFTLLTTIATAGPQLVSLGAEFVGQIIGGLLSRITDLSTESGGIGKAIVQGVLNGIKGMGNFLKESLRSFFTGIVNGVKSTLGIHSPSTVFAGIGENMGAGLDKGLTSGMKDARDTMRSAVDGMLTEADRMPKVIGSRVVQIADYRRNKTVQYATGGSTQTGGEVVWKLVDSAGRTIAKASSKPMDQINGEETSLRARGVAV